MDKIDFTKYTEFPVSAETFDFMQDMIKQVGALANVLGPYVIVSGCELNEAQTERAPGWVSVNGEIMPYEGGMNTSTVGVLETKQGVQVYDQNYSDIYIRRKLVSMTGPSAIDWLLFKNISTISNLTSSGRIRFMGRPIYPTSSSEQLLYFEKWGGDIEISGFMMQQAIDIAHNIGHSRYFVLVDSAGRRAYSTYYQDSYFWINFPAGYEYIDFTLTILSF